MNVLSLIEACEQVYDKAQFQAGPLGTDACSLTKQADGGFVLALRGTLTNDDMPSFVDWLNDFRDVQKQAPDMLGLVHHGFLESLDYLTPTINHILKDVPTGKLVITGHSKGGSVAQLCGCRWKKWQPQVVTFAAPLVGNRAWAQAYPVDLTRYEGEFDIVPLLPPLFFAGAGERLSDGCASRLHREAVAAHRLFLQQWPTIIAAHQLETGYRPWIEAGENRAASAAAA